MWSESAETPHPTLRALYATQPSPSSEAAKPAKAGMRGDPAPRETKETPTPKKDEIRQQPNKDTEEAEVREKEKKNKEKEPKLREEKELPDSSQKKKPSRMLPSIFGWQLRIILALALLVLLLLFLLWFYGLGGGGGKALPGSANAPSVSLEKPTEEKPPEIKNRPTVKPELLITFVPSDDPEEAKQLICHVSWTNPTTGGRETRCVERDPQKWKLKDFLWDLEKEIRDWLNDVSDSETPIQPVVIVRTVPFPGGGTIEEIRKIVDAISKDRRPDPSVAIEILNE